MWRPRLGDESEVITEKHSETASPQGHTMYEYELQQLRTNDLIRRADHERLVREAARARRAARHEAGQDSAEHESHSRRFRRPRSARTA